MTNYNFDGVQYWKYLKLVGHLLEIVANIVS